MFWQRISSKFWNACTYTSALCAYAAFFSFMPARKILSIMIWAESSEFVSSSIPSWQILAAHAQPFRRTKDLAFRLKVPLDSLLVWASSGGSGETARRRRLAWTFAARIGDKYQIRLARPILKDIYKRALKILFAVACRLSCHSIFEVGAWIQNFS